MTISPQSAVALALVASNPASPKSLASVQQIRETLDRKIGRDKMISRINSAYKLAVERARNKHLAQVNSLQKGQKKQKKMLRAEFVEKKVQLDQKLHEELNQVPPESSERSRVKTTVILTSVTLMGQW